MLIEPENLVLHQWFWNSMGWWDRWISVELHK